LDNGVIGYDVFCWAGVCKLLNKFMPLSHGQVGQTILIVRSLTLL
jgi:hypothetical protein